MNRSRSQAMTAFLPGAVFRHEQRLRGRVQAVDGDVVKKLNEDVIYDEISHTAPSGLGHLGEFVCHRPRTVGGGHRPHTPLRGLPAPVRPHALMSP
ncbi:hypothetical protein SUDANB145_07350 (plasmid) [Streptomyces sp. enrichment culture]